MYVLAQYELLLCFGGGGGGGSCSLLYYWRQSNTGIVLVDLVLPAIVGKIDESCQVM